MWVKDPQGLEINMKKKGFYHRTQVQSDYDFLSSQTEGSCQVDCIIYTDQP